jgi:uncharacterized SAM-binding protein YcdF (DUF218 family)
VVFCLLIASAPWWLFPWLGNAVVRDEIPCSADVVVTLAGDTSGLRQVKGVELVKSGLAPNLIANGAAGMYGTTEASQAAAFAQRLGLSADQVEGLQLPANSTQEELHHLVAALKSRSVHKFILVTSNYHTYRAGWIAERTPGLPPFCVVASQFGKFSASGWWKDREQTETMLGELARILNTWREMLLQ